MRKQRVAVFGSTGSIGRSTLEVLSHMADRFEVCALAAGTSSDVLCRQALLYRPRRVVLTDEDAYATARRRLGPGVDVLHGIRPLVDIASAHGTDIIVMAMSGTDGLRPVMAALEVGKRVALATKELLVSYGRQVMDAARRGKAELLPVDSELSALLQCLNGRPPKQVRRLILTASGGPFWRAGPPHDAHVAETLRHPTWSMGRKITVDSATLMNKGLEVIETSRLFGIDAGRIETVIHPQSIVHSLVEFEDSSVLAQLSEPDMRLPIQYALTYPDRVASPVRPLAIPGLRRLEFHPTDPSRFPCLGLAYRALRSGAAATCALNAANQTAVEAYLDGRIAFGHIPVIIAAVLRQLARSTNLNGTDLRTLMHVEQWAASAALALVSTKSGRSRQRRTVR